MKDGYLIYRNDAVPLNIAIPDEFEDDIPILFQGNAANNHPLNGWIGSLIEFNTGKGYWLNANHDGLLLATRVPISAPGRQNKISIPISFHSQWNNHLLY